MDDPDFGGAWHGAVFYLSLEVTYGRYPEYDELLKKHTVELDGFL